MGILSPVNFLDFVFTHVLNTGSFTAQYVALASSLSRQSWCRSRHFWRWKSRKMCSPRVSSRNHSPNFVFSKALIFSVVGLLSSDVLAQDCCCRRCCRCCFLRRFGFYPHREGNGFQMHAWGFIFVSTLFDSCEPYSWYSTVGVEDSQHRLSKFSSFSRNDEPLFIIHDVSEFI